MRKLRIAAFMPHPDDMEGHVGGTLLKYVQQGHHVDVVVAADGRRGRGILPEDLTWQEIVALRKEEAIRGASYLGITPTFLDIEDHRLVDDRECYETVINEMERINPDVVFTTSPDDYHNDHRAISRLVLNTSWAPVFFADTKVSVNFIPDFYVDITQQFETKVKMLGEHVSQLKPGWEEIIHTVNRLRGMQCMKEEIKYAEGYKVFKRLSWVKAYELLPEDSFEVNTQIVPTTERN
jgi:LmbE family N-acetylglucosaminyl deacetylase